MNIDINLSLVLGHTIWFETKNNYSPNGIVDDAINGGDGPPQGLNESTAQQLSAYQQYLPGLLQTTANSTLPYQQAMMNAQKSISPQQMQLTTDLMAKYAPQLNAIGNNINGQNSMASAQNNLNVLNGPGSALLQKTQDLQKQLDPEYYATRALAGQKSNDLLNSINLNGLSGSERAEVERSNNQQNGQRGILNAPSQMATVENAMNFGSALQGKRNAMGQAIGQATGFMQGAQGPINAFQTTTGQPSGGPNQGAGQFGQASSNTMNGQDVMGFGTNMLNNLSGTQLNNANINANRRDTLDRTTGVMSSLPSIS